MSRLSTDQEKQLDEAVTRYFKAAESGQAPQRSDFLIQHPDLADELNEFFTDQDQLERWTAPLRTFDPAATVIEDLASRPAGDTAGGRFGDYELLEEIARGGMGIVYKARQMSLDRVVALKMILKGQFAGEEDVLRFQAEARAVAALDHPHIVPIHEVGQHEGQHYFSMKLIEGGSLAHRLMKQGLPSLAEAASTVAQAARAVHYAHQRGILHRDLKPGNILLDSQGQMHVADFGLAKRTSGPDENIQQASGQSTPSGAIVGTPSYMAPEQALAEKKLTTAADVYGLGAILYELLTGRPPFKGKATVDTILQVVQLEPERPRNLQPRLDRDLETICLKCLEKDPARRYGSAEALADDLERWLGHEPIRARRSSVWERAVKWSRRRPAVAVLVALLAIVTAAAFGVVTWLWQSEQGVRVIAQQAETKAEKKADDEKQQREKAEQARRDAEDERQKAQAALERSEMLLYFNRVGLAHSEWQSGNVSRAEELLDLCPPSRRHWEWHFLKRLCHRELFSLPHGTAPVWVVAYSPPDGKQLATGSTGWYVRLYDAASDKPDGELVGHTSSVGSLAYSPDGKRLASAERNGKIIIWDAVSRKLLRRLDMGPEPIHRICFHPDGKRLAVASLHDKTSSWLIKLIDADTGKELFRHTEEAFQGMIGMAFRPDGKHLAIAAKRFIILDVDTREIVHLPTKEKWKGSGIPQCAAYSPNGKLLAFGRGGPDDSILLWDVAAGKELTTWPGHSVGVMHVEFSQDSSRLVSAGRDCLVKIWDVASGRVIKTLRGHDGAVQWAAFRPGSQQLATASFDHTVKVWDLTLPEQTLIRNGRMGSTRSLVFSPDGHHILSSPDSHKAFQLSGVESGREVFFEYLKTGIENPSSGLAFHPDGKQFAVLMTDGEVSLRNAAHGKETKRLKGHGPAALGVAYSPDGRRLATFGRDGFIKLLDVATGKEVQAWRAHRTPLMGLAFSPDSTRIVSTSRTEIKLWDATAKELAGRELDVRGDQANVVAFSPNGERLVVTRPRHLEIWPANLSGHKPLLTLRGHQSLISAVAFSPDGRRIVSAGHDRTVRIFDAASSEMILTLRGPDGWLTQVAFSSDGRFLATCGNGALGVTVWDGAPWQEKAETK